MSERGKNARQEHSVSHPAPLQVSRWWLAVSAVLLGGVPAVSESTPRVVAADYEVGPGRALQTPNDVPWESLRAGDRVRIYWRPEPYRSKWVLCCRGTRERPIIVEGVPNSQGRLPVISGREATTRVALDYWGEDRSVIKIGGANHAEDRVPAHIVVRRLEIRDALPALFFFGRRGIARYRKNAAGIFIESGTHIVVEECILTRCGNGLFVAPGALDVVVQGCRIFGNGIEGSIYEHNVYTECDRITFQGNWLGPLRDGCRGNNLKDRSAGLVVRYNWIEGGNRQLDLVEPEEGQHLLARPYYRRTYVYGNVLIEREGDGNNQIVHYGGDNGDVPTYRKGRLLFYHNTVISMRSDSTTVFRLSTNAESADCFNNVFFCAAPSGRLALLESAGQLRLLRNWLPGRTVPSSERLRGTVLGLETSIRGATPGFADDAQAGWQLRAGSPCRDAGYPLPAELTRAFAVTHEFRFPAGVRPRRSTGRPDLGAFEYAPPGESVELQRNAATGGDRDG